MASERHGRLGEFNAEVDSVKNCKERFLLYCVANELEKAVFLTCVYTVTYTLLKNMVRPEKLQDKSLDELFALWESLFLPRIIVIAEIFGVYQRL